MTNPLRALVLGATFCAIVVPPAAAQGSERGKGEEKNRAKAEQASRAGFTTRDRRIIVEFFAHHEYQPESLPPGIVKRLARGKPLPPGIAKKQLPSGLRERLPGREGDGVEVTIFGDRIVLLEASGLVVDILEGVFR